MVEAVTIAYLSDHQAMMATIEAHFKTQWHAYYGPGGPGDACADIAALCNKAKLPIGLIALRLGTFVGFVALRKKTDSHHDLSPWVTSFYVAPEMRRQGVGTRLVKTVECLAGKLGYKRIYARSATAVPFFEKHNWEPFDTLEHDAEQLTIFLKDLLAKPIQAI
jgi:GNAT superfamily N-acetyltransferase